MTPEVASLSIDFATRAPRAARLDALARQLDFGPIGGRVRWRGWGLHGRRRPPLVLLHGGHGNWMHWVRNIEALAEERAVWVPDMPGYGDSDAVDEGGLDTLLARLMAGIAQLPGVPERGVDLAGFSFGGLVAAHLAARATEAPESNEMALQVHHLLLLGPAGHGGARRPRGALQDWHAAAQAQDTAALAAIMRHNLLMHMLHDDAAIDDEALALHTRACQATRFRSKRLSRAGGLQALVAAHAGPAAAVWGMHDVTVDPAEAAALVGCPAQIIPGAGHWVQYEAATQVNAWLREALGG
ncbi:alpha/beta fold hydrolase [uncultured Pseudacidovorax sp.]|uniref:alpha/beta fold hydrolase n=1 Tax=uncultured Pseudacidovorax sp. TaxID=679313 RepID=UPI0025CECC71|nr:alpha/beta fold hydrolase [uncultured Pseudacidovorax sp.]